MQATANPRIAIPDILENPSMVEVVDSNVKLTPQRFKNRMEVGKYLTELLEPVTVSLQDENLWAWLTQYFFDSACPIEEDGIRKVKIKYRYIPDMKNYQRYYRHCLYGPFSIYYSHKDDPDRALAVLCDPLHIFGDVTERLAGQRDLIASKAIVQAATELYYDPETVRNKPGSAKHILRFIAVVNQLILTYDLYHIGYKKLLDLLPEEFDKYKN